MMKDSSNSSSWWFEPLPNALEDQDDLEIDCDRMSGKSNSDHDSSGSTTPTTLDDLELYDVTSKQ